MLIPTKAPKTDKDSLIRLGSSTTHCPQHDTYSWKSYSFFVSLYPITEHLDQESLPLIGGAFPTAEIVMMGLFFVCLFLSYRTNSYFSASSFVVHHYTTNLSICHAKCITMFSAELPVYS